MRRRRGCLFGILLAGVILLSSCAAVQPPPLSLPLPTGAADSSGEVLSNGVYRITGWALSQDPIQTIALYLDGRYVSAAHGGQPHAGMTANCGWSAEIDSHLFRGKHELVVQVRTLHGLTRDLVQTQVGF